MPNQKPRAIVVGAGIVGLAATRALAEKGFQVQVFERSPMQVGASIRNFGMVWPIGQPAGALYERAMRSRAIWQELCIAGNIWHRPTGSLLAAHRPLEMEVLEEFMQKDGREHTALLKASQTLAKSPALKKEGLLGALWSSDELIVDPREAIRNIPAVLSQQYDVEFHFNAHVRELDAPYVWVGDKKLEAEQIWVCSGPDFETLYPEIYRQAPITKCKVQMMRTAVQPDHWNIEASLCAGLTLVHYKAFAEMDALVALRKLYEQELPDQMRYGIHVLISQNGLGEITIGDTHEYGLHLEPFDNTEMNDRVIEYLRSFAQFADMRIAQSWHGIYPKTTDGSTAFVARPQEGVTIVNGLGGAGMTLSFGLLQELVEGN